MNSGLLAALDSAVAARRLAVKVYHGFILLTCLNPQFVFMSFPGLVSGCLGRIREGRRIQSWADRVRWPPYGPAGVDRLQRPHSGRLYGLVFSNAEDSFRNEVGFDAAYREATSRTIYLLDDHKYFLHEVKEGEAVLVETRIPACDANRLHSARIRSYRPRRFRRRCWSDWRRRFSSEKRSVACGGRRGR